MENTIDYTKLTQEELIAAIKAKDEETAKKDASALEQIQKLKQEVLKKKDAVAIPTVTIDDKVYEIIVANPKIVRGGITTDHKAEELAEDTELCKELIERGSGIIVLKQ